MTYYIHIENDNIISCGEVPMGEGFTSIEVSEEVYNNFVEDNDKYIYSDGEIIENPDYEEIKARKHRQELDALTLTPADVERALLKAKGMDFEDLKTFLKNKGYTDLQIKAIGVELRASDFFRGATLNGIRIVDAIGGLLGYTTEDMDYLFIHKDLPNGESSEGVAT